MMAADRKRKTRCGIVSTIVLALLVCVFFFSPDGVFAQHTSLDNQLDNQEETDHEKIVPSPKDQKERTAILVFIGWLWLTIIVLIFVLGYKIKEEDRLHSYRFFTKSKK